MSEPHSFGQQKTYEEENISKHLFSKSFFSVPFLTDEELPLEAGNISAAGSPGCFCLQVSENSVQGFSAGNFLPLYPRCFSVHHALHCLGLAVRSGQCDPQRPLSVVRNTSGHLPQVVESTVLVGL